MAMTADLEGAGMITISKGKLKAQTLRVFRQIEETGEEVIVRDNGRPVLRIERIKTRRPTEEAFAGLQGKVVYHEGVNSPAAGEWEAARCKNGVPFR
jgi:antitoxin (DNA-binding transcriptional repressor) of toxin-antitoxin stability system